MKQPLVLISQVQRSGGTLLSQLFDGHSECNVHPHEIYIGNPKWIWPVIDLNMSPGNIFDKLVEKYNFKFYEKGYEKQTCKENTDIKSYVFDLNPEEQKKIFIKRFKNKPPSTQRDVFNIYFYSYFSAWKNDKNKAGNKKIILGFVPRLSCVSESVDKYFRAYPEGKIISVVREPFGWYASSLKHGAKIFKKSKDIRVYYIESLKSVLRNIETYGDKIKAIEFSDVVSRTEQTMRELCGFLGIGFENIVLNPTFNKEKIETNSNFVESIKKGVVKDPLNRKNKLTKKQIVEVEKKLLPLYNKVIKKIRST
ncbi:hypothetical protein CMI47_04800 [Candidatus Pacearchaeota archaeon]|nr:hypothetical protein [Candidatus Pacearchaeota archaeon]|tara:strand:- start:476 stop:1405 length:930 start_codon:yes stop_codon:yes gene_type:complete